jgi:hypothetical protein
MATGSDIHLNTLDSVDMSSVDGISAKTSQRESVSLGRSMSPMKRVILQDEQDGPFLG